MRTSVIVSLALLLSIPIILAEENESLPLGSEAPSFFLRTVEGESFFMSKVIAQGNPILLSFYATWCVPCRAEIPAYEAMLKDSAFADVRVFYVHVGEPTRKPGKAGEDADYSLLSTMKEDLGMSFPILLDKYGVTAEKYMASSLPTSCIIDGAGKVAYHHSGYKAGDEDQVRDLLLKLLE